MLLTRLHVLSALPSRAATIRNMHLYALISVICLVLTFSHVHASGTHMDTRELGIADIPACGVRG